MHAVKSSAPNDLLATPRYARLVHQAVQRATGAEADHDPPPLAFAQPKRPQFQPRRIHQDAQDDEASGPLQPGKPFVYRPYRADREHKNHNNNMIGHAGGVAEEDGVLGRRGGRPSLQQEQQGKSVQQPLHPFDGLEENPLAMLRECIKYLLAHPEQHGNNVRKLLEDELQDVVKIWATETSTNIDVAHRYLIAESSFLPPINKGVGGLSRADTLRTFVENNAFDVWKRSMPAEMLAAAPPPEGSEALLLPASRSLALLPNTCAALVAQEDEKELLVSRSGAVAATATAKAAVSETFALRIYIAELEKKMQASNRLAESFRTELHLMDRKFKQQETDDRQTMAEMEKQQDELTHLREQVGHAVTELSVADLKRKDMHEQFKAEEKKIRKKVTELEEELKYVYGQLRMAATSADNTATEVNSLTYGYSQTQLEVEMLSRELSDKIKMLEKRNRVVQMQRAMMERQHAQMLQVAQSVKDIQSFAGDRSIATSMVQDHVAWKLFLAHRMHRRDFHYFDESGLAALYGVPVPHPSIKSPGQAPTLPPRDLIMNNVLRHYIPSSDGGYCNFSSFSLKLWRDVANLYIDQEELDQKGAAQMVAQSSPPVLRSLQQHPIAVGVVTPQEHDGATAGGTPLVDQAPLSAVSSAVLVADAPFAAASFGPGCLFVAWKNPFVLRYSGRASVLIGNVILEATRHLHVFNVASLLSPVCSALSPAKNDSKGKKTARGKKAAESSSPSPVVASQPNGIFMSRAAGRAILYSFWRQRYAAYLVMMSRRKDDGLSSSRSFSDENPPTPPDFVTALYFFLENAFGTKDLSSVAQTIRPATPTPCPKAVASDAGSPAKASKGSFGSQSPKSPGFKSPGSNASLKRQKQEHTLPEHALQPAQLQDAGNPATQTMSADASLVLHSLLALAMEYKEVDADFRLFYCVAFQQMPEVYAINFFAITSKLFAESDRILLENCDVELVKSEQLKKSRRPSGLGGAKVHMSDLRVDSVALQIPRFIADLAELAPFDADEDGGGSDAANVKTLKGSLADAQPPELSPRDTSALRSPVHSPFQQGITPLMTPRDESLLTVPPSVRSIASLKGAATQLRRFLESSKETNTSAEEKLHRAEQQSQTLNRVHSRLLRSINSTKLPFHTFMELVQRIGFSVLEVALPLVRNTRNGFSAPSLSSSWNTRMFDSSPVLSHLYNNRAATAGVAVEPLAVHCQIGMTALESQRVAFALSMDAPGNVVSVQDLFQVDPHGRPSNFYDEFLSVYLDSIEKTQSEWVHEVVLPSCRCNSLRTTQDRIEQCRGIVAEAALAKNIEHFLSKRLKEGKQKSSATNDGSSSSGGDGPAGGGNSTGSFSPGRSSIDASLLVNADGAALDVSKSAVAHAGKLLAKSFLSYCEENDDVRSSTGDTVPRAYGVFAAKYPVDFRLNSSFCGAMGSDAAAHHDTGSQRRSFRGRGAAGAQGGPAGPQGSVQDKGVSILTAGLVSRQIVFLIPVLGPVALSKEDLTKLAPTDDSNPCSSSAFSPTKVKPPATAAATSTSPSCPPRVIIGPRVLPTTVLVRFETELLQEFERADHRMKNQNALHNPLRWLLASRDEESRLLINLGKKKSPTAAKGLGSIRDASRVYWAPAAMPVTATGGIDLAYSGKGYFPRDDGEGDEQLTAWALHDYYERCSMPLEFALQSLSTRRLQNRIPPCILPLLSYRVDGYNYLRNSVGLALSHSDK